MIPSWLTFSDSAKYADAARELVLGHSMAIHHGFFDVNFLRNYASGQLFPAKFLPLPSLFLAGIFKIFPVNDLTIVLSGTALYLICVLLIVWIANRLGGFKSAFISVIIFLSQSWFYDYAINASSEIFFTLELLFFAATYLVKSKWKYLGIIPLVLMWITRPQAMVVIIALGISWILNSGKNKLRNIVIFCLILGAVFLVSLIDVSSKYLPLRAMYSAQIQSGVNQGEYLRGRAFDNSNLGLKQIFSKVFYNTYNFAKNPERLISPGLLFLLILGLSLKKNELTQKFSQFTLILFGLFILAAAVSIPNARYVHPVIPLVGILIAVTLSNLIKKLRLIFLLLFLISLPILGHFTVDQRFTRQVVNTDKPPINRLIALEMIKVIPENKLVITNLDAWAGWYGSLTTMWFPLTPDMLKGYENKISYIVITNYKESDADFSLGDWKEVVYSPEKLTNKFLLENYKVLKTFVINPSADYEKQEIHGTILVRK